VAYESSKGEGGPRRVSTARWLVVLVLLVCIGTAIPAEAGCPRERHAFHGTMIGWAGNTRPIEWGSRWIWVRGGDRLVVAAVGERPEPGYWELRIWSDAAQSYYIYPPVRSFDGSRMLLDYTASHTGWHKAIVVLTWGASPGRVFHATFDVSDPAECGPPGYQLDFCHGAVGSNCTPTPLPPPLPPITRSDPTPDGMRRMEVSVGSMAHDTCCSRSPNGKRCGGRWEDGSCSMEWDWAVEAQLNAWNFSQLFNPTVPYYPPHQSVVLTSANKPVNLRAFPFGLTFPDEHRVPAYAFDTSVAWCSSGRGVRSDPRYYCCGTSRYCYGRGSNPLVSLECSRQTTVEQCHAKGCAWYWCGSESTPQMKADPVCMPRGTAIDVACPTLRSISCRDRRTATSCSAMAPRCWWTGASCELATWGY